MRPFCGDPSVNWAPRRFIGSLDKFKEVPCWHGSSSTGRAEKCLLSLVRSYFNTRILEGRMRHILPMAVFLQVALWLVRSWPCCLLSLHCLLLVLSVCAVLFISDMLFVTPHFCQELCHIHVPSLCFNKHRLSWGLNSPAEQFPVWLQTCRDSKKSYLVQNHL